MIQPHFICDRCNLETDTTIPHCPYMDETPCKLRWTNYREMFGSIAMSKRAPSGSTEAPVL